MTITVANTANTNTWEYLINRLNELSHAMTTYTVTTDSNTASGNAAISGSFSSNAVSVTQFVYVGNSTANITITAPNTTQISNGNFVLNANGSYTSLIQTVSVTTSGLSEQTLDSFAANTHNGCKYLIHIKNGFNDDHQASEILVLHNGAGVLTPNAFTTEYAIIHSNGVLGSFSATSNGTHAALKITPSVSSANVTFSRNLF